jgi:hypothetical protein
VNIVCIVSVALTPEVFLSVHAKPGFFVVPLNAILTSLATIVHPFEINCEGVYNYCENWELGKCNNYQVKTAKPVNHPRTATVTKGRGK